MSRLRLVLPTLFGVLLASSWAGAAEPTKKECAAANESAQDLRRAGKLREARAGLAVCTAASCPGPIREDCAQRLKEVENSTPTVVFEARDSVGHDLSAVRVTMDGARLLDKLDGTAIAADPGQHQFAFEANGFHKTEDTVVLREGEKDRRVRVVLESPTAPAHKVEEADTSWFDASTRRSFGFALGAAGAAGIALGSIFGLVAKATYEHATQSECTGIPSPCSSQGVLDGQLAHSQATVSTVAFIGGGALLAGGLLLYLTALPSGDVAVGATATNGGAGLSLRGKW